MDLIKKCGTSILDVTGKFRRAKSELLKAIEGSKWILLVRVSLGTLASRNLLSTTMAVVGNVALSVIDP